MLYLLRLAFAVRWMRPLVEPPIACSTTWAFLNEDGVSNSLGRGPLALAIAAATRPLASAERKRSACGAGMVALIGSDHPSASAMQAMVEAVPITMQVPTDGASLLFTASISASSIPPSRDFAHSLRQAVQAPNTSPL